LVSAIIANGSIRKSMYQTARLLNMLNIPMQQAAQNISYAL
jgi:hypothetical protein